MKILVNEAGRNFEDNFNAQVSSGSSASSWDNLEHRLLINSKEKCAWQYGGRNE